MMLGKLARQCECELGQFPSEDAEGQRCQRLGVALPGNKRGEHPASTAAKQIGTTLESLIKVSSSTLMTRFLVCARVWINATRGRVRSRSAPIGGGGDKAGPNQVMY